MSEVSFLWLQDNPLTGVIPSELGQLSTLSAIRLEDCQLTGHIPSQLGLMTALESLHFEFNILSGPIPSEMGLQTSLDFIAMHSNKLTGSIPVEIGHLPLLRFLKLSNNHLTGPIPELGNVVSNSGTGVLVTLQDNTLSGIVPESLCSLGPVSYWGLGFDCNDMLCGCDWCPCVQAGTNSTN